MTDAMWQTDHRGSDWHGPITELELSGPSTWQGKWNDVVNNAVHTIKIELDIPTMAIKIFEFQPEQHWVGSYTLNSGIYLGAGHLDNGAGDRVFTIKVTLPQS